jgi:hypothetical protein
MKLRILWPSWATKSDVAEIQQRLATIERKVDALLQQGVRTMATVKDIQDQAQKVLDAVAAESSKDDSIIALVQGNTAQIAALKQQLADAIAAGADPAALQAVLDSMTAAEQSALANAQKVTDAINANTPTV